MLKEEEKLVDKGKKDQKGETEVNTDRVIQLFGVFTPVLLVLATGIMLIVEWRGTQTEQIAQLKEKDREIIISLTRQIEEVRAALSVQLEDTSKHIVLNRKYMEKNREEAKECLERIAKFEGIFFDSRNIFGESVPDRSLLNHSTRRR